MKYILNNNLVSLQSNKLDSNKLQKMIFFFNALENGWTIYKNNDTYIFIKKHENKEEIFKDSYIDTFINSNIAINI